MRKKWSLGSVAALLSVVTAGSALMLVLAEPQALQTLRHQGFDQYQRWQPRIHEAVPVRIIDIDEASLEKVGQWPWPRNKLAQLVEQLGAQGAVAIGFDVVFAEPDRTSPGRVSAQWALSPELARSLQALPDNDATFAQAIAAHNVVLGFALRSDAEVPRSQPAMAQAPYRYVWLGEPSPQVLHGFSAAVQPLPELHAAAKGSGALTFMPDGDGVVRRVPMAMALAGAPVPSLSAELLRVAQGVDNHILRGAEGPVPALAQVRIGQTTVPTNAQGEMWLHYTTEQPARYVPAWRVLAGESTAWDAPRGFR